MVYNVLRTVAYIVLWYPTLEYGGNNLYPAESI